MSRILCFSCLFAAALSYDQVVLHASTSRELRLAMEVTRQVRAACLLDKKTRCPYVTLWTTGSERDRSLADEVREYSTEGVARVFEGITLEKGNSLISLDLSKWTPCRSLGDWLMEGVTGDFVSIAPQPSPGEPVEADLAVVVASWTSPGSVAAYLDAARAVMKRDSVRSEWSKSTAVDVAREAAHGTDIEVRPLDRNLRCATCSLNRQCLGADERQLKVENKGWKRKRQAVNNDTQVWRLAHAVLGNNRRMRCLKGATKNLAMARSPAKPKVVLVSGVNLRPHVEFIDVDLALSKRLYAARHGYAFAFYVADAFERTMIDAFGGATPPWEFVKIFMMQEAAHSYPDAEWVVWVDADAWINPLTSQMPLEAWLDEAHSHKLAVLANYRGLNTGVLAIRGGPRGRAFMSAWSSAATAGLAQCHPHDQAALQMVQLWYMNGSLPLMRRPYDYDCTKKTMSNACGGHWSCIPLWHGAIVKAHEYNSPRFNIGEHKWDLGEIVDRGYANAQTTGFHIASENAKRPKLQCFNCLDSLERATLFPGKNFKITDPRALDGWLVNHKGHMLFYRQAFAASADPLNPCFVDTKNRQVKDLVIRPPIKKHR